MNMAKKKSRNEAVQAIAAIKDLLIGNLLPERKLMYFDKQPRLRSDATEQEMILWTFEDWLKGWYYQVLQTIEVYRRVIWLISGVIYGSFAFREKSYDFIHP
jgi:ribosome biogenesis protein MAK21